MVLNKYLIIFLFSNLVTHSVSLVFLGPGGEISSRCSGTLTVYEGAEDHQFSTSVESLGVGIMARRVVMEGCGCYILYQGPRRMGRAYFVTRSGEHEINLGRIGSVYKEKCGMKGHKNAGVIFWVIGVVLGVVGVVVGGVICVRMRKKKMYEEVIPESVL
jgi:hypothetical protein